MRTARPFRAKAIELSVPTYVFTLASVHTDIGQPLVSVAQVTEQSFDTMEEYAQFLLHQRDRKFMSSRLTRVGRRDNQLGWRFGDCHADSRGDVGEPHEGHVHYADKTWKADINGKHLILVSNRFLLWSKPVFVAVTTQKQSRFGKNIDCTNLRQLLKI